jgi:DNA repair protein RecO (recombination protein O)
VEKTEFRLIKMRFLKTEAVVLKSNLISEKDKIATLFTKDYGKLQAIAKGARRSKSRFVNAVRPFIIANYVIFEGQNYYYIDQWELVENFEHIERDLDKFAMASYATETIMKVTEDKQKSETLYFFLKHSLKAINQLNIKPSVFVFAYTLKLVSFLGYMPVLDSCALCGSKYNLQYFSPSCGGVVCQNCKTSCNDAISVEDRILKFMIYLLRSKYERLENIFIPRIIRMDMDRIISEYVKFHVGVEFKSREFVIELEEGRDKGDR